MEAFRGTGISQNKVWKDKTFSVQKMTVGVSKDSVEKGILIVVHDGEKKEALGIVISYEDAISLSEHVQSIVKGR